MIRFLFSLFVFFSFGAFSAERKDEVPQQFQGDWATDPASCQRGRGDSILQIQRDFISFYASHGPILAVVIQDENEMAIIAELSGEGYTWLSYNLFTLSPDSNQLKDATRKPPFVRVRCQKG